MERLQKVLSRAGIASRRAAETLIAAGRVTVNGSVVTRLGTQVDPERDAIRVDGTRVRAGHPAPQYLMLHKPRGVVTTLSDPEGRPTVRDYLHGVRGRVFPVGRLDYASEGLLLLTSDGALARDLMHPSRAVPKTYAAKVRGTPPPEALRRLASGLVLEGRRTLPAKARLLEGGRNAWVEVTVIEGRKHQVRDMLAAVGHPVQRLRRIRYGGVDLGDLPPGRLRALSPPEVARLRRAAGHVIP
jgi:pseudouridine synthase